MEELDLDDGYALDVEPIAAPEDWTGPVDTVKRDELGYSETDMTQEDWEALLREAGVPEEAVEAVEEERCLSATGFE